MDSTKINPKDVWMFKDHIVLGKRDQLIKNLEWLIAGAQGAIQDLKEGRQLGLMGFLQNTWDLYRAAGEYDLSLETNKYFKELQKLEKEEV